ncbi:hypothetical protein BWI93_03885 [Siphonobacter sp. BAB-5385]|uniref:DUF1016 N-terminal domain-containing protein n=1 Tax=Siphonobacter sp. BAB-5385 TaxID=1864822 RepID=UPI000B9E83D2|nr:DUF1016 N-terminal domain-containing protein [Siphonobacter sp. BAB-5385]OZI09456.1 hypothetical protein BWI93_03885 [Siphonobacter sp. BAB-5385]
MIGLYVVEFEQHGEDRARYGQNLIPSIATTLSKRGHKGFAKSNLYNYKNFYLAYPQIFQTLSGKLDLSNHPTIYR